MLKHGIKSHEILDGIDKTKRHMGASSITIQQKEDAMKVGFQIQIYIWFGPTQIQG